MNPSKKEAGRSRTDGSLRSGVASPAPKPVASAISGTKKWIFSLLAFVLFPLLLLALVEAGLRLGGYGHSTRFLRPMQIGGKEFLVDNDKFGLRFFPPELSRSPPPVAIPAAKEPGTVRVFVVGESAALGDPRPAFGPGRGLQALLEQRYPGMRFEVVSAAMTAINSHGLLPIVRECAKYSPDAWILYLGNNEMVGPFGAASVFGARAPSAAYVRFALTLQKLRLGQLLTAAARRWAGHHAGETAWGGMKMFLESQIPPGDPRKETVYANFRKNLEEILEVCHRSGAPTVLNTVAVNLKDCAPFASVATAGGITLDGESFSGLLSLAKAAEQAGKHRDAVGFLKDALRRQPAYAEAEFRVGSDLLRMADASEAREYFEKARDHDALPFRADSRINATVAETAAKHPGVTLFDAAGLFAANSPGGIAGAKFFLEHVHFSSAGNYLLARAWAEQLERLLPALAGKSKDNWATEQACERWLAMTDWNRYSICEDMLRRIAQPPFINQFNHEEQIEALRTQRRDLRQELTTNAAVAAAEVYAEALKRSPADHRLHENFAEFLEATGNSGRAAAEWEQVRELLPHHHVAWFQQGRLLMRLGKMEEARKLLEKAVALRPDLAEGWLELGQLHALAGRPQEALEHFEREGKLAPWDHRAHYHIGQALLKLNRRSEGMESLRQALQLKTNFWEARYAMAEELAFQGKTAEAQREFQEVIRLKPDYPMAHFNLGVALAQVGDREAALRQFEETLRLDPRNALAADYLRRMKP